MKKIALIFCVLISVNGCVINPISQEEISTLKEIQALKLPAKKIVDPEKARELNTAPGLGNMYLAWHYPEEYSSQILPGLLYAAFWPMTIPLSKRLVYEDAEIINQRYTLNYYREGKGLNELEQRKKDVEMMMRFDLWEK